MANFYIHTISCLQYLPPDVNHFAVNAVSTEWIEVGALVFPYPCSVVGLFKINYTEFEFTPNSGACYQLNYFDTAYDWCVGTVRGISFKITLSNHWNIIFGERGACIKQFFWILYHFFWSKFILTPENLKKKRNLSTLLPPRPYTVCTS